MCMYRQQSYEKLGKIQNLLSLPNDDDTSSATLLTWRILQLCVYRRVGQHTSAQMHSYTHIQMYKHNTFHAFANPMLSVAHRLCGQVPSAFMLCKGRSWLIPMMSVGPKIRMACALPAVLLTVRQRFSKVMHAFFVLVKGVSLERSIAVVHFEVFLCFSGRLLEGPTAAAFCEGFHDVLKEGVSLKTYFRGFF